MTTYRPFKMTDLFNFNAVNLDHWTETYSPSYYYHYICTHADLCTVATDAQRRVTGYMIGKSEGSGKHWHGHITALSIAQQYRQLSIGSKLSQQLYDTCNTVYKDYFIDLYVRCGNVNAIEMYKKLGYSLYRQVLNYYGKNEHAYDMRKACDRDTDKQSIIQHVPFKVKPSELDVG